MIWTMYGDYVIIVGEHIVKCEHKDFVNSEGTK